MSQGQPVGRLGISGDTNGPHVHYQLQSGPSWTTADALPRTISNVSVERLVRRQLLPRDVSAGHRGDRQQSNTDQQIPFRSR